MAHDAFEAPSPARILADVLGDISELVQREIRLARAELTEKMGGVVRSGVWMAAAGLAGAFAALLVIEAIVFALAAAGFALHWACLIVAAGLAVCGGAAFAYGRSAQQNLVPKRILRQINADIRTVKEQLT